MSKLAVLFPGIGYTCDKPLLYYSGKLLKSLDYVIIPVQYTCFTENVKKDPARMQKAAHMALEQAEEILDHVEWADYNEILFVSKSLGTVVSSAYAQRHRIPCRQILFTPVEAAFQFAGRNAIAFHGTKDPVANTAVIEENCRRLKIMLYETDAAKYALTP